jgi:hypothetical protein
MRFIRKLLLLIIYILIFLIFAITVYFCLDVFGVVEIPVKYSIASIFYSEIELIADKGRSFDEIFDQVIVNDSNSIPETKERFEKKKKLLLII